MDMNQIQMLNSETTQKIAKYHLWKNFFHALFFLEEEHLDDDTNDEQAKDSLYIFIVASINELNKIESVTKHSGR